MKTKVNHKLDSLSDLISEIKKKSDEIGAIIIFIGIVRGKSQEGEQVLRLEYEAHETLAIKVLKNLVKEVISKHNIIDGIAEHRIGQVKVGEDIMYILVASKHRKEGFKALEELVDRIKREVPIWKKEVTEKRSYWVEERI